MQMFLITGNGRLANLRLALLTMIVFSALFMVAPPASRAQAVLLGDQTVEGQVDSDPLGMAEAFQSTATTTGQLSSIKVYLNSNSTARTIVIGLYANAGTHPGTLLTQGSSSTLTVGNWNTITVPTVSVTAGTVYWLAILGTQSGLPVFRDRHSGPCKSESSSQGTLTALPASWTTGAVYSDCPLSAYGQGTTASTPILSVSPTSISLNATQGGANPAAANVGISNTGSGTLSFTTSSDSSWLSASSSAGTAPATLQLTANISGLTPNTYTGHVTITSTTTGTTGSPATVTVTLNVAAQPPPTPILTVSPATIGFSALQGGANPASSPVSITNTGGGTLSYSTSSDSSWLSAAPATGTAPQTLQVSANITGLPVNTYVGHITVTATGAQGSPATITATLNVTPVSSPPAAGDWLTIDHDSSRSGNASSEVTITPGNAANLTRLWSLNVNGKVTAEPLFISGITVGGQLHDVLIVGTANNSVYALDAKTGAVLWTRNFGSEENNCAINGGFGVTGSPVIDRARLRIYLVSNAGEFRTLSLADGTDAFPAMSLIPNPVTNKVWGGLNLFGNNVYIATASDGCDTAPWRGTIYRVDVSGSSPVVAGSVAVVPSISAPNGGGGIWGYGGVAVDPATGNVYAATGDDSFESYTPNSDRLLGLASDLTVLGSFLPSEPPNFPCAGTPCDLDFGATPAVFQPTNCPTMMAAGNKNGNLYLFRTSDLLANGQPLQTLSVNPPNDSLGAGGLGGVPAFWPAGNMLFLSDVGPGVTGIKGGVVGLTFTTACTAQVTWSQTLGGNGAPDSTPTIANGVVFVGEGNGGVVHAFNALSGAPLWTSGSNISGVATFAAPIVANGALFVGSWAGFGASDGGVVTAFSIPGAPPPPTVLLGSQNVESQADSNAGGTAEAFQATTVSSGTLQSVSVFVDTANVATSIVVGIYSDTGSHPSALLTQGTISAPVAGAWNTVNVTPLNIANGTSYWIAILGAQGGRIGFRDRVNGGCKSEYHSQTSLTALPNSWITGQLFSDCPLSAYGTSGSVAQPVLNVSASILGFSATQGGANPAPTSLTVSNTGSGSLAFNATSDANWLSASPGSGSAPANLQVSVNISGLAANTYTGHVTVTSTTAGVQGSPAIVTVTLTVAAPPPNPILNVAPATATFSAVQGGANPASATVNITNSGGGTLNYTTSSDAAWLTASPATGTAPQALSVSANISGLAVNTYTGHITVTAAGAQNSPATITVTLTVSSSGPPNTVLLGDQTIESQRDNDSNGTAEAFRSTATATGALSSITFYLDASSTASTVTIGLYMNSGTHPGALLAQASTTQPKAGAWNTVTVPATSIASGTTYWFAILGSQSGAIQFRDRANGACSSETSSQTTLTSLPSTWSTGHTYTDCPLSAYGQ